MKKKGLVILSLLIALVAVAVSLFHLFKSDDDKPIEDETPEMAEGSQGGAQAGATQSGSEGEGQGAQE